MPTPLRTALRARDRTCRFPGCENRRFVHAHHIRHWSRGGETCLQNLVLLCSRHHRLVHEGGYAVDERLRFYDPRGRRIPSVHGPPRGHSSRLCTHARNATTLWSGDGRRMDLGAAVDALLKATATTRPP